MSEKDEARDALLANMMEALNVMGEQHLVLVGLVRALVIERAEDDPDTGARLVEIVENAFVLDEAQRQFLAQMTSIAPSEVAEESPAITAH